MLKNREFRPQDMDMDYTLSNCSDFRKEKSALQNLFEKHGHILVPSVKCHPETAGKGIEYCWGLAESNFRKINKGIAKELEKNVSLALCLSMSSIFKFERKTRDYMRLYLKLGVKPDGPLSYKELEDKRKHMKTYRSHRNVAEIEREFINTV